MNLDYQAFPVGACPACLKRWRDTGLPGQERPLDGGGVLLSGYCAEREAGFYAIVGPDRVVREWSIRVPVAIEEWRRYLQILPQTLAGAARALRDASDQSGDTD
jgi:hypothetical protein